MATHARIFYYTQRIGVNIDFAKYQSWLAAHPNHEPPQVLPAEFQDTEREEDVLPWQQAAPKAELYVDKSAQAADSAASGGAEQPNYPMGFAEMIKLLQEGKPIPGIKQIPNTIARDPVCLCHLLLRNCLLMRRSPSSLLALDPLPKNPGRGMLPRRRQR